MRGKWAARLSTPERSEGCGAAVGSGAEQGREAGRSAGLRLQELRARRGWEEEPRLDLESDSRSGAQVAALRNPSRWRGTGPGSHPRGPRGWLQRVCSVVNSFLWKGNGTEVLGF